MPGSTHPKAWPRRKWAVSHAIAGHNMFKRTDCEPHFKHATIPCILCSLCRAPPGELLPVVVPAESLFLAPGRGSRPARVVIILRGLSGSGKSAAARKLRELELMAGGDAPRVHSIDDYFVTVRLQPRP